MRRWILALMTVCGFVQNVSAQAVIQGRVVTSTTVLYGNQQRLAHMDAIVVGRVIGLEPMDVSAPAAPGQANTDYRIAVVQINDGLHGVRKGATMIRVGFPMQAGGANVFANPGGGVQAQPALPGFARIRSVAGVQLQVGQDGLFLLAKHHKENFYLVPNYNHFVTSQNNTNFDNEVRNAKQLATVLGDLPAALKSDDRQSRFLAAAVLISRYRNNATGLAMKQEPIDAAESKLILKALSEGDWTPGRFSATQPTPIELFQQLGITANDGYRPVAGNQQNVAQAMQKWLSDNSSKYVIKKLVADPNAKAVPALPANVRPAPVRRGIGQAPGVLPVAPPPARE